MDFTTKDSGERESYDSGMVRDLQKGKPRFDLIFPAGVPYDEQMFTRFAAHMARGAEKYGDRNWEKASSQEEVDRARSSAMRHMIQWFCGEVDEDHAAAVMFNVIMVETIKGQIAKNHEKLQDALGVVADRMLIKGDRSLNCPICHDELRQSAVRSEEWGCWDRHHGWRHVFEDGALGSWMDSPMGIKVVEE